MHADPACRMTQPPQNDLYVSRRELDMLKAASDVEHAKIWTKIESLDSHGSRGMDGLQIRMDNLKSDFADLKVELLKDVGELKIEMNNRFQGIQDHKWKRIGGCAAGVTPPAALGGARAVVRGGRTCARDDTRC